MRAAQPIHKNIETGEEHVIPFNSAIKFNLAIRDMAPNERTPDSPEANMTIFIKGATERILRRVKKIRMQDSSGQLYDAPFDEAARQDVQSAEQKFG